MTLDAIRELVRADFEAVDRTIQAELRSDVVLINQLGQYLVSAGGKRLRPLLVLLTARALGYPGQDHVRLAAVVEFIHTATLLHDDVVDASSLRRGRDTANAVWGNEAAVLTGDFLYSRAFQMMVQADAMRVMAVMADATNLIAEGEVLQLLNQHDPDTDEARYLEVIARKTAKLFEAGARLAAVLAGAEPRLEAAVAEYGLRLGCAFQLVDDVLDYTAEAGEMGKNLGDDLAEGKPTLPVIRAMQVGTPAQRALLREAIEQGGAGQIEAVLAAIRATDALDYTQAAAAREAEAARLALAPLPDSEFKAALHALARVAVERRA